MLQGILQVLQGVSGAKGGHGMQGSYELFFKAPNPLLEHFYLWSLSYIPLQSVISWKKDFITHWKEIKKSQVWEWLIALKMYRAENFRFSSRNSLVLPQHPECAIGAGNQCLLSAHECNTSAHVPESPLSDGFLAKQTAAHSRGQHQAFLCRITSDSLKLQHSPNRY